jgi:tetratricopeptide (TPR) repeat protein
VVPSTTTRRAVAIAALLACAGVGAALRAEEVEAAPPVLAPPAPPPPGQVAILPVEKSADLMAHWAQRREYLRERDQRRAEDEEQRVRQLKDELALENLFGVAAALVRESHATLAAESPALARKACKLAAELAPALSAAHTCVARATLAEDAFAVRFALASTAAAVRAALADPRSARAMAANAGGLAVTGLLAAALAFVLLLFVRYAQLYVHDVHHLFPAGARRWQTNLLAAALILSPLLLQAGFVPLLFTLLFAVALYATAAEVALGCTALVLLAALPFASQGLASVAAFGGPAADVWMLEHGEGTPRELRRLQERLRADKPELAVAFALAHKAKREGELALAEQLYRKALDAGQGASYQALAAAHNNLGNVYLLQGDAQRAVPQYQKAMDLQDSLAAPHFNLSRAWALGGVDSLEKVQAEQARALELDRAGIDAFTGGQLAVNRRSNKFLLDVPLDESMLEPLREAEAKVAAPVDDEVRALIAGPLPAGAATALPLLAALGFVGLHALRRRLRPSGRCERCGREVCKRCDGDARPSEALCAQCVNVFVRRTGVDPTERVRKEIAVQAYQRRRTILARLLNLLSGAGHVFLGYPVSGVAFLLLTGLLASSVFFWHGLLHDPIAVRANTSLLRVGATVACFVLIWAICLRDLAAKQRAEGG